MASELKSKEHLLHAFQKKASDTSYESKMFAEISVLYSNYIKNLAIFKASNPLLCLKMSEVSQKAKATSISDLLKTYENFDALIS